MDIFKLRILSGRVDFSIPNKIIVSKSTAERYFGNEDPVGKVITTDDNLSLEITGIYQDFPRNSSFDFNVLGSFRTLSFFDNPSWNNARFETFALLHPDANVSQVEEKLQSLLDQKVEPSKQWFTLELQPLNRIHL